MTTENVNERFVDIDSWASIEAVEAMLEGQLAAVAAVKPTVPLIADASDAAAERLAQGGRLIYVGAGTSGRLAVQDGVELTPTYGWPEDKLAYVIAGGVDGLVKSVERAEDDELTAIKELEKLNVNKTDVIIGVAASGKTPFTLAALEKGHSCGALTIGVCNNANTPIVNSADFGLCAETGSECVAGSTRMKAGTAQKVTLNIFSTMTMIRCGRIYNGLMVNMLISNDKLRHRAAEIVQTISDKSFDVAAAAINEADDDISVAVLICLGVKKDAAETLLRDNNRNLRRAIEVTER